jgi:hypothetical protein
MEFSFSFSFLLYCLSIPEVTQRKRCANECLLQLAGIKCKRNVVVAVVNAEFIRL